MYDVKCLAKKHLRTTIAEISHPVISFKITHDCYDVLRLYMADMD